MVGLIDFPVLYAYVESAGTLVHSDGEFVPGTLLEREFLPGGIGRIAYGDGQKVGIGCDFLRREEQTEAFTVPVRGDSAGLSLCGHAAGRQVYRRRSLDIADCQFLGRGCKLLGGEADARLDIYNQVAHQVRCLDADLS